MSRGRGEASMACEIGPSRTGIFKNSTHSVLSKRGMCIVRGSICQPLKRLGGQNLMQSYGIGSVYLIRKKEHLKLVDSLYSKIGSTRLIPVKFFKTFHLANKTFLAHREIKIQKFLSSINQFLNPKG